MDQHIQNIAYHCYEALDCAHSLSGYLLLKYGEYDQIATKRVDPSWFLDAESYRRAAQASDLLRKLDALPTTFDKKAVGMDTWWSSERSCYRTNRRISDLLDPETGSAHWIEFFSSVRKIISTILGRVPLSIPYRFGPGATYESRGKRSSIPDKLSNIPEMTGQAWVFLRDWRDTAWCRSHSNLFEDTMYSYEFRSVPGNRLVAVPKDGKTDRIIGIEPSLNIFVQLGIGSLLRGQLNRLGLLRENSQEIHRKMAMKASSDGALATIDLSSASDTVAFNLVEAIMPTQWFELLVNSRSPMSVLPNGRAVKLEKFSSMGNGYTFELETLVFASLCLYVSEKLQVELNIGENFSVYGDDIIIPSSIAAVVTDLLAHCGFTINSEKSFFSGPFRESCGGDYFNGTDVRSVFLKTVPCDVPSWFSLHNQLVKRFLISDIVVQNLPRSLRNLGGPVELGDCVLHSRVPNTRTTNSIRYYRGVIPFSGKIPLNKWDDLTAVASLLYGVPSEGISLRNTIDGYRKRWIPFS